MTSTRLLPPMTAEILNKVIFYEPGPDRVSALDLDIGMVVPGFVGRTAPTGRYELLTIASLDVHEKYTNIFFVGYETVPPSCVSNFSFIKVSC